MSRELVFAVRVCTEKWDLSRQRRSLRGRFPNPKLCTFHSASRGTCVRPSRVGAGARFPVTRVLLRRFKERCSSTTAAPRRNICFFTRNQLESPTLEGGSGDAPHSDGRRALAVAATRRPVKPKVQLLAVDHSAHVSMKSGASSVN